MAKDDQRPPKCPAEMRGVIGHMESIMARGGQNNSAMTPTLVMKELMERGLLDGFPTFEGWLRDMDSRVHLIGAPLDIYGPEWADKTEYMPFQPGKQGDPDFTLWVGVNGLSEATGMLARLEITPEENLTRLDRTGLLVVQASQG